MLEADGKELESKNEIIDAITGIIDSSPRTEVVKAGHDSIQRIKGWNKIQLWLWLCLWCNSIFIPFS